MQVSCDRGGRGLAVRGPQKSLLIHPPKEKCAKGDLTRSFDLVSVGHEQSDELRFTGSGWRSSIDIG